MSKVGNLQIMCCNLARVMHESNISSHFGVGKMYSDEGNLSLTYIYNNYPYIGFDDDKDSRKRSKQRNWRHLEIDMIRKWLVMKGIEELAFSYHPFRSRKDRGYPFAMILNTTKTKKVEEAVNRIRMEVMAEISKKT